VSDRIVVTNLVKRYGKRTVVNGVTADVNRGEVVGLLGPNGAGKTTTFYMVVGLVRPDDGVVLLERDGSSRNMTRAPMHERARAGIGYLAQENSIFRKLSVGDNLRLIWEMNGVSHAQQEQRLPELLDEFGLSRFVDARGDSLSGGERRRVSITR
jgi:lipopolysaccharide export system ATP-binding protein